MDFANKQPKTVAITGASNGFGGRLAHNFAAGGFDLLLCGRDRERLHGTRDAIASECDRHCGLLAVDLRTASGQVEFAAALHEHRVDIVVNNAAVNPELATGNRALSATEMADVIASNTVAAIAVCQSAFDHLQSRSYGIIVNINSIAGLRGSGHEPVYAASKFGLRGFSESVKDAWLGKGVRMIDLYPGALATGMSAGRPDVNTLIDPDELSRFVVDLCRTDSFYAREINIQKAAGAARPARRVVFANGVFDILHPGHLALLRFARSLGDKLIVGLNSDRSVRELKGPARPINDEQSRKASLECIRFVDEVVIFDQIRTTDIVRQLQPNIVVKGDEYTAEQVRGTDSLPGSVQIVTFPVVRGANGERLSTTAIVERMRQGH